MNTKNWYIIRTIEDELLGDHGFPETLIPALRDGLKDVGPNGHAYDVLDYIESKAKTASEKSWLNKNDKKLIKVLTRDYDLRENRLTFKQFCENSMLMDRPRKKYPKRSFKLGDKVKITDKKHDWYGKIGTIIRGKNWGVNGIYMVGIDNSLMSDRIHQDYLEKVLEESKINMDIYLNTHGKAFRSDGGPGNFFFSNKRYDHDLNNAKETFEFRGTWKEAQKAAKKWAKENGHIDVYLLP